MLRSRFLAVVLYLYSAKSSFVQPWGLTSGHSSMSSRVSSCWPQMQSVLPVWKPHLARFDLVLATPDRIRFRHCHSFHGAWCLGESDSSGGQSMVLLGWAMFRCCFQSSVLALVEFMAKGTVQSKKLFLDFRRLDAGGCWYIMWLASSSCFSPSHCLATSLRIEGGAMPASWYTLSTFVFFRQPVMLRQQVLSAGSRVLVCADLPQTGQAYSAVE